MSIFAIGDLHLSFNTDKPMNIFGENWNNYEEKIKKDWLKKVKDTDLVLLPGDFSWAMKLEDTYKDFEYINNLPGKKILLKGNHDYWWNTVKKMNEFIKNNNFTNIEFLYNNSFLYENYIICGTRGWTISNNEEDRKIFERELLRLELSLNDGINKYGSDKEIIVCMHYPPITKNNIPQNDTNIKIIDLLKKYNVTKCIYGHLHGASHKEAIEKKISQIEFKLVSSDYLNFELYKINK